MRRRISIVTSLAALAAALIACSSSDGGSAGGTPDGGGGTSGSSGTGGTSGTSGTTTGPSPLTRAITAVGGAGNLAALHSVGVSAVAQRFDPGEGARPGGPLVPVGPSTYTLTHDLAGDRLHLEWGITSFLVGTKIDYKSSISGAAGWVDGSDGLFTPAKSGLQPSRVAADRKEQTLLDPVALLRRLSADASASSALPDDAGQHGVEIHGPSPIRLYFDGATGLPSRARVVEDDPLEGDVTLEALYTDWRTDGALKFPHAVALSLNGAVIHNESRSSVAPNVAAPDTLFALDPASALPADSDDAQRGEHRSEWFHRFLALSLNLDAKEQETKVVLNDLAPGVVFVGGGFYNSMAVELDTSILVVEAPLDDARSHAVMAALATKWPGKPVKWVVNTHAHFDHAGGLRAYVAAGATVVMAEANQDYLTKTFKAPHTVVPDALAKAPVDAKIQTVGKDGFELIDGTRLIKIFPMATSHAESMLVVHLAAEKILFTSDLFNPGIFPADQVIPETVPFRRWANDLLDGLAATTTDVTSIVGGHGGIGTMDSLKKNAGR